MEHNNPAKFMKITFFIPDFKGGGAQNMMINMANEFARRGHDTTILTINRSGPYTEKVAPDVTINSLDKNRTGQAFFALRSWLGKNNPDTVISALFYINVLLLLAKLTLPRLRTKIIVTERNHFSARIKHSNRTMDKLFPILVFLFYRFADRVIGISQGVADDISKIARLPAKKVSWIHNPVITQEMMDAIREPQNLPWDDAPVIVTSGRLVPQKDYPTLLRAFAGLLETRKAYLYILGDGPLRQELENMTKDLNIKNNVRFAGFVDHPIRHMVKADLFALSPRWEGFCNVIVEALLCGLPVVSTNCPSGPAEILDGGTYGMLVPVDDTDALAVAMNKALNTSPDPSRQKARAMDFTVEKICDQYQEVIETL